jgi:uncharacterized protein YjbJ (UPF0337 family)
VSRWVPTTSWGTKAEELKGKAKDTAGELSGDEQLQAEGQSDQAKGNMKQAGEKVEDVFKSGARRTPTPGSVEHRAVRALLGTAAGCGVRWLRCRRCVNLW